MTIKKTTASKGLCNRFYCFLMVSMIALQFGKMTDLVQNSTAVFQLNFSENISAPRWVLGFDYVELAFPVQT